MDPWTIIASVAVVIGMIAGVVQVLDYVQRVREKKQTPGPSTAAPAGTVAAEPPDAQMVTPAPPATARQSATVARTNLPAQATPLIGREEEAEAVISILKTPGVRLVTLTGPGGVGKSRLAIRVAEMMAESYPDGVYFVPLADVNDASLLAPAIAREVGVKESGPVPVREVLKTYLRDRRMLLLLDNFEQAVQGVHVVGEIMAAGPGVQVLATSRSALRLYGEREYAVQPLELPDLKRLPTPDKLAQNEAVTLFVERARAVKPNFALTSENTPAIAEICVRLDGLPLAIELAAARARLLTPQAMLERLKGSLSIVSGGARDLPARQQTLVGAIGWSYDLLDGGEQALFRRLAAFVGGCTLEGAEAVVSRQSSVVSEAGAPTTDNVDVLDRLESLIDKSLLRQMEMGGEPRFVMLWTIRGFGLERLRESGEADKVHKAHAAFYLKLAEEAEPKLTGAEQVVWMDRLEVEHENLRAALDWSVESGDPDMALRIAGALLWFWQTRGYLTEGRERLARILAMAGADGYKTARSKALLTAGRLATLQGDYGAARAAFEENLGIQRELGDKNGISHALIALGSAASVQGDYAAARDFYREGLELQRELGGNPFYTGMALVGLGEAELNEGNHAGAESPLQESLEAFRKVGNKAGEAFSLYNQGYAALANGEFERAKSLLRESLLLRRELGNKQSMALSMVGLAEVACLQGPGEAEASLYAARLLGAAQALLEATGTRISPADATRMQRTVEQARAGIDETAWGAAQDEGAVMPLDEAVAMALAGLKSKV